MYTKIIGTGSYLPEQVRTNADLEKMVDTSDEWIVTRTGIRERHIAAPNETVSTMGFEAATRAIEMAGIEKDQIGLIVVATTSATHAFPSAACQIQSMLGIKGCPPSSDELNSLDSRGRRLAASAIHHNYRRHADGWK